MIAPISINPGLLQDCFTGTLWSTRILSQPENFQETLLISSRFPGVLDTLLYHSSQFTYVLTVTQSYHLYADDTQLFISIQPRSFTENISRLQVAQILLHFRENSAQFCYIPVEVPQFWFPSTRQTGYISFHLRRFQRIPVIPISMQLSSFKLLKCHLQGDHALFDCLSYLVSNVTRSSEQMQCIQMATL